MTQKSPIAASISALEKGLAELKRDPFRCDTSHIKEALQQLRAARDAGGWQDISTAPKNETKVDLWAVFEKGPRRVCDAYFKGCWHLGQYTEDQYEVRPIITHWRIQPAAPQPVSDK